MDHAPALLYGECDMLLATGSDEGRLAAKKWYDSKEGTTEHEGKTMVNHGKPWVSRSLFQYLFPLLGMEDSESTVQTIRIVERPMFRLWDSTKSASVGLCVQLPQMWTAIFPGLCPPIYQ